MSKYLPSKKFIIIALSVFVVLAIILFITGKLKKTPEDTLVMKDNWSLTKETAEAQTLGELIKKDSDQDGIPDWEEALWGLDYNNPKTDSEVADADYVAKRRQALEQETAPAGDAKLKDLSETDKLAQEFFATIAALKQAGSLDERAVSNIANVLGQKITTVNLPEPFFLADIEHTADTKNDRFDYYNQMQILFAAELPRGLGTEIDLVAGVLPGVIFSVIPDRLRDISAGYQSFALKAKGLAVPRTLVKTHLKIINGAFNTGVAVSNLAETGKDPVVGLIGVAQYQKYSEEFIRSSEELRQTILDSVIIENNFETSENEFE